MSFRTLSSILVSQAAEDTASQKKRAGFALVLALALLSFLFLLILALISYIGVETRLAESHKAYSLARATAQWVPW